MTQGAKQGKQQIIALTLDVRSFYFHVLCICCWHYSATILTPCICYHLLRNDLVQTGTALIFDPLRAFAHFGLCLPQLVALYHAIPYHTTPHHTVHYRTLPYLGLLLLQLAALLHAVCYLAFQFHDLVLQTCHSCAYQFQLCAKICILQA